MVLARCSYQLINIVSQVLNPYMIVSTPLPPPSAPQPSGTSRITVSDRPRVSQNPEEWNWAGKAGFFWGGTCLLTFCWAFFRLPEIKGRTYEELDILFVNRTPARKFASTHVDAYASASPEVHVAEVKDY